jgi:hypothetical protein
MHTKSGEGTPCQRTVSCSFSGQQPAGFHAFGTDALAVRALDAPFDTSNDAARHRSRVLTANRATPTCLDLLGLWPLVRDAAWTAENGR